MHLSGFRAILGMAAIVVPVSEGWSAQEASPSADSYLEEVVVTARKREERLQDLPGSAAALTESMIEDVGGINSLRDVTDFIPGITIVEAASPDLMEPSIRGAGQSRNRSSVSATGFYRNGAYFASQSLGGRSFARMDSYDVARVEVLRGPQGALYGRNALGGAMNIISVKPDDEFDLILGAKAGQKDRLGYELITNLPITDILSTRFSFIADEQEEGFYKDQFGDSVDVYDYEHFRGGIRLQPSDGLDVYYSYDVSEETYEPGINQRIRPTQTDVRQTLINTRHDSDYDLQNHALTIDYDLANGTLTSVSNYRDRDVHRYEDQDFALANLALATNSTRIRQTFVDAEIFYQDLRYASDLSGPFQFLVGADYYTLETREVIDDFAGGGQTVGTSIIRDWEVSQDSWALYGSVDYRFDAIPLTLSGELRYARDDVEGSIVTVTPNVGPDPVLDFSGSNEFTNYPWTLSAAWAFESLPSVLSDAMAYFKIGSSYRHGGLNLGTGLPSDAFPTVPVYDEEDSISYEIGLKTSWFDNRMTFNAAAFWTEYNDFLDTTTNGCPELCPYLDPDTLESLGFDANGNPILIAPDGDPGLQSPTAFFIDNVGEIEAWGIELETSFTVPVGNRGGRLTGNLGWSRQMGEVTEIGDDVSPAVADQLGARLNFVRPQQFKTNLIFDHPLGIQSLGAPRFLVVATYTHEHGGVRGVDADPITLDGVDRLDMRVGLEADRWSLIVNGSNVLDQVYDLDRTATLFRLSDPDYYWLEFTWRYR